MPILDYVGNLIPVSVNFLRSRAGLATVGYTLLDQNLSVFQARTTIGVTEIVLGSVHTGLYTAQLTFANGFTGYIVWDTGQPDNGTEPNKLRIAEEEISILTVAGADIIAQALDNVNVAVTALYEENVMKIPNGPTPDALRIVRKRSDAATWDNPLSDMTVPIDQRPGRLRFGGPPLS